ncbi:DMT family transporter [Thermoactinomyces sp. DSM 45892]|uniref:DMT family transporter n=1 Tax=Thermoactinomyces sp. DSM 45892 TaxID=1882753 RepID=UPI000B84C0D3|nr:DMT family transporter [Thermoactinomyces sp. DSM 45892]
MKGIFFAIIGGGFLTLQGVANSHITQGIGTWKTATITQLTGFIVSYIILMLTRDYHWESLKQVKPLFLTGGALGAIIIFSNVTAIHQIGVTLTVALLLISQLGFTFITDRFGWFEGKKQEVRPSQLMGIGMMVLGVAILQFA